MRLKRRTLVVAAAGGVLVVVVLGALLARMANSDDAVLWRSSERVAFDGTNYFVVWIEHGEGIYGARVSEDGAVLDQPAISISTEPTGGGDPRVAFNGTDYLVAWADSRHSMIGDARNDAYAARVSPTGKVLDRTGIAIATMAYDGQVGVASDGTNFLVVWDGVDARTSESTIRGARIDDAGEVLDPEGFSISKGEEEQVTPSVAFDGTNYLVAWHDTRYRPDWDSNIYGARVSRAGKVIDPAPFVISGSPKVLNGPSIAAGDGQYLVTWTHLRNDFDYDVWGARVSSEGTVLDSEGLLIGFAPEHQWLPNAAFDGTNYLVAWEDLRRGYEKPHVYGTRVSRTGDVLEPVGMAISKARPVQEMPSVGFGDENYLATWMEALDDSGDVFDIYAVRVDKDGEVIDRPPIPISTRN